MVGVPADERFFGVFVPVALAGVWIARVLSPAVEADRPQWLGRRVLARLRPVVLRLAALFAVDSFAGGFALQAFVAYWMTRRFDATIAQVGLVFAVVGVLQTLSFLAAARLAERFGLLPTMVLSHLPSNVLLAAMASRQASRSPSRCCWPAPFSQQMDVPTRQAYVMALVDPAERTAAAAATNTAVSRRAPGRSDPGWGRGLGRPRRAVRARRDDQEHLRRGAVALVP